jgi:hypothetical protein
MRALAALLTGLLALTGCGDDPFSSAEERALSQARARWEAAGVTNYLVEVRLQCFCEPSRPDFTRLEVHDGEVVSAEYLGEPSGHTATSLEAWPTVPDAFDLIENASRDSFVDSIEADYDPDLGYPLRVEIGCQPNVLDCGSVYEFRNLEPDPRP